jgi:hypothetical protein
MENTWANRDFPVLDAVVRLLEHKAGVFGSDIARATGFDAGTVAQALAALEGPYVVAVRRDMGSGSSGWSITKVTADARRVVSQWPSPESLVDRLAEAFGTAADGEPDDEKKGRLRQVASFLGSTGRDVATEVVSKVILRSAGMG